MTKLQIDGKLISYSILEFTSDEVMFLQEIREKVYVDFNDIFFVRKDYKKLGYKNLSEVKTVAHFSGFISNDIQSIKPVGVFTFIKNGKKEFISALNRLERRYHLKLYNEYCDVFSDCQTLELTYKRRRGYKYFFLQHEGVGVFNIDFECDLQLKQLFFRQIKLYSNKVLFHPIQILNVMLGKDKLNILKQKQKSFKQIITAL
jgi:hypothetical protein